MFHSVTSQSGVCFLLSLVLRHSTVLYCLLCKTQLPSLLTRLCRRGPCTVSSVETTSNECVEAVQQDHRRLTCICTYIAHNTYQSMHTHKPGTHTHCAGSRVCPIQGADSLGVSPPTKLGFHSNLKFVT